MDMYQKRKIRSENKKQESFPNVSINCEEWANAKLLENIEKY